MTWLSETHTSFPAPRCGNVENWCVSGHRPPTARAGTLAEYRNNRASSQSTWHQTDATGPLCFFNTVTPVDVGWNFSAPAGFVPPFLTNTIVTQPDVEDMMLSVRTDWNRNRMTMACVLNVYNVNRDSDPMNVSQRYRVTQWPNERVTETLFP